MKTSTTYKMQTLRRAIKEGQKPMIQLRGDATLYQVEDVRNLNYAAELRLNRRGGTVVIDPDDILLVKVITMPTSPNEEAIRHD